MHEQTINDENGEGKGAVDSTRDRRVAAPPVDIFEDQGGYLVFADLPGVKAEDVEVRFEEGELRLRARRAPINEVGLIANERVDADLERAFKIPEDVEAAQIEAALKDGVLRLKLPKSRRNEPRKIAVQTA